MFQNAQNTPLHQLTKAEVFAKLKNPQNAKNTNIKDDIAYVSEVVHTQLTWNNFIHFDLTYTPWKHLGYKMAVATATKLIACNARLDLIQVSISCSSLYSLEALEELMLGVYACANDFNFSATLSDVSTTKEGIFITMAASSKSIKKKNIFADTAIKNGDLICVSGDLGAAYLGLLLLEREKRIFKDNPDFQPDLEGKDYIVAKQLKPNLRADIISLLKEQEVVINAGVAVTDGLAKSLSQLIANKEFGIVIYEEKLPIDTETHMQCMDFGIDPTVAMLNGGEDYELCFSIPQSEFEKLQCIKELSIIGYVTDANLDVQISLRSGNLQKIEELRLQ